MKLNDNNLKLLWRHLFIDHVINGVCEINNRKYWFHEIHMNHNQIVYGIYFLEDDEIIRLVEDHEVFREYVGIHTDCLDNRFNFAFGSVAKRENWPIFYSKARYQPSVEGRKVVGSFKIKNNKIIGEFGA